MQFGINFNPLSTREGVAFSAPSKNGIYQSQISPLFSELISKIDSSIANSHGTHLSSGTHIVYVFMTQINWITTNFLMVAKTPKNTLVLKEWKLILDAVKNAFKSLSKVPGYCSVEVSATNYRIRAYGTQILIKTPGGPI